MPQPVADKRTSCQKLRRSCGHVVIHIIFCPFCHLTSWLSGWPIIGPDWQISMCNILCMFNYWISSLSFFLNLNRLRLSFFEMLKMKFTYMYRVIFFKTGRILFLNSSKTKRATIKYHSSKEADIHGNLFDTCDEKVWSLLFS